MGEGAKDWIQAVSWLVASVGGLIAAFKAIAELRRGRIERVREFRWRQARLAAEQLAGLSSDSQALAALKMLDWSGLSFDTLSGKTAAITHQLMLGALRTSNTEFTDDEKFVRDAFDHLFDWLERLEHFRAVELVAMGDIEPGLSYYVGLLAKDREVFRNYMNTYRFTAALHLLNSFREWCSADLAPRDTPPGATEPLSD